MKHLCSEAGWEWERDRHPEPERSFTRSGEGHLIRDIVGEKYIINFLVDIGAHDDKDKCITYYKFQDGYWKRMGWEGQPES